MPLVRLAAARRRRTTPSWSQRLLFASQIWVAESDHRSVAVSPDAYASVSSLVNLSRSR
jgi:hypothetical protein